jgi:hypothetical protein
VFEVDFRGLASGLAIIVYSDFRARSLWGDLGVGWGVVVWGCLLGVVFGVCFLLGLLCSFCGITGVGGGWGWLVWGWGWGWVWVS